MQRDAVAPVALEPLTIEELLGIATLHPPARFRGVPEGALPPQHVAERALAQLEAGCPAIWCVPYVIVAQPEGLVAGGCTFKGRPVGGEVEIAYGLAKAMRGRGIASAAVAQLLALAARSGEVRQVLAEIVLDNTASSKVVSRLGFLPGDPFVDADGETVRRWAYPITQQAALVQAENTAKYSN